MPPTSEHDVTIKFISINSQNKETFMSVKYIIVPLKILSKPEEPPVSYPRLKSTGEINLRKIVQEIS